MTKFFNLRNVAAIVACLAVSLMFTGCDPDPINEPDPIDNPDPGGNPDPGENPDPGGVLTEITGAITQNTTLKDLGLPIDYVYKYDGLLDVQNNAVLTIEPGVTIQFTSTGGGISVKDGAEIRAVGTAAKHIQFVGVGTQKGSWDCIRIHSNAENKFEYVDFINGGKKASGVGFGVVELWSDAAQINMSHCKISGSLGNGVHCASGYSVIPTFKDNVIEGCVTPMRFVDVRQIANLDMTSTYPNNTNNYIIIDRLYLPSMSNLTINRTSVPYNFLDGGSLYSTLTINEGVTFYMNPEVGLSVNNSTGTLMINGTAANPVTFTRVPGTAAYWGGINISYNGYHVINHCIVEYGATQNGYGMFMLSDGVNLTLNNVIIRNSRHYGVFVYTGRSNVVVSHTNVTFTDNASGNVHWYDDKIYADFPPN